MRLLMATNAAAAIVALTGMASSSLVAGRWWAVIRRSNARDSHLPLTTPLPTYHPLLLKIKVDDLPYPQPTQKLQDEDSRQKTGVIQEYLPVIPIQKQDEGEHPGGQG